MTLVRLEPAAPRSRVKHSVLLSNCKQSIMSMSLMVGTTERIYICMDKYSTLTCPAELGYIENSEDPDQLAPYGAI